MKLVTRGAALLVAGPEPVVGGHIRLYGEGTVFVGTPDNSGLWYDNGDAAYVLRRISEDAYQEVAGQERRTYKARADG